MLRDQVRRSKKSRPTPPAKRIVRSTAKARPPKMRSSRSVKTSKSNFLPILIILLLVVASLWYGFSHLYAYLTLAASPQFTLLMSQENDSQTQQLWLLAEGRESTPRYFSVSLQAELTTGLIPGLTWSDLAMAYTASTTAQESRTIVSQALGVPISRIISLTSAAEDWNSVLEELRQSAAAALRSGEVTDDSVHLWLVARKSEGETKAQSIEAVMTQLSRQNLSAITNKERCPVAVLNNSGKSGFASLFGRILEQNGGTVLRIANALSVGESDLFNLAATTVLLHPNESAACGDTLATITTLLPQPPIREDALLADQYRASVVVILGLDAQLPTTAAVPNPRQ